MDLGYLKRLWTLLQKHPVITIIVLEIIASLIADTKSIAVYFGKPFAWLGVELAPATDTPDLMKILYWVLCTLLYWAIFRSLYHLVRAVLRPVDVLKTGEQTNTPPQLELYIEEIAAAMEVVDRTRVTEEEAAAAIEDLLREVSDSILQSFHGLPLRKIRHAFLLGDASDGVTMVSLGRRRTLTHHDRLAVDWLLTNFNETHYLKSDLKSFVIGHDMEAIGFVRNPGPQFQFGFVIFLPKGELLTEEAVLRFYASSSAIQLLTYMDKLMQVMVKYRVKLEGGRSL